MMGILGERAVVAGGSMAGMLAARVLADFFTEVIVLDRDNITDQPADRPMTPQSQHVHILLKGGEIALNGLFPGISKELAECGSVQMNMSREMINANPMGRAEPWDAGITLQAQSRALLEHQVRKRVYACSNNIKFMYQCTVRGLLHDSQENRITGVEIDDVNGHRDSIMADLVIDASGRGAGGVRWLSALKLEIPRVQEVKVDFGYSSCKLKLRDSAQRDWNGVLCGGLPPDGVRGSLLLPIEGGMHICSAGGRFGDFPPKDEAGFREFVQNIGADAMHEAIGDAEVVSPFASIRYEYNRFRHYEELKNLPRGFLVIGDALCSVNPTYGQGMSSATLQAKELADILDSLDAEQGMDRIAELFFPRAVDVATVIWRQANFNDLAYTRTEGDRTMFSEEEVAYNMALQMLAVRDLDVRRTLVHVNHFLLAPSALRSDEILRKVEALKTAAA